MDMIRTVLLFVRGTLRIHDAIVHMTTEQDLRAAIGTAVSHCRPGRGVVFLPDYTLETFRENSQVGGHDGAGNANRILSQ
jgi:hypothetical protein